MNILSCLWTCLYLGISQLLPQSFNFSLKQCFIGLVCFLLFYPFHCKSELDLFSHLQHLGLERLLKNTCCYSLMWEYSCKKECLLFGFMRVWTKNGNSELVSFIAIVILSEMTFEIIFQKSLRQGASQELEDKAVYWVT